MNDLLTERYGGGRAHVLIAVLVDQGMQIVRLHIHVVHQDMVMRRTRCTLNSAV